MFGLIQARENAWRILDSWPERRLWSASDVASLLPHPAEEGAVTTQLASMAGGDGRNICHYPEQRRRS